MGTNGKDSGVRECTLDVAMGHFFTNFPFFSLISFVGSCIKEGGKVATITVHFGEKSLEAVFSRKGGFGPNYVKNILHENFSADRMNFSVDRTSDGRDISFCTTFEDERKY